MPETLLSSLILFCLVSLNIPFRFLFLIYRREDESMWVRPMMQTLVFEGHCAIVCYLHPPLQLGWCAVSDPEHRCIFWPGGCCHPHGPPCRLQGRDGGGSGCSALAGPTAHPLGEYFFQHFFFQLGLTWYKQSFSIRDAPFLYSSFICSARNLEIIIKTIPTHSVSPRRSRCILRYVPFFFSCSEITLNLTVQLGENEILTLSLAVYVPSEEVSIPACELMTVQCVLARDVNNSASLWSPH